MKAKLETLWSRGAGVPAPVFTAGQLDVLKLIAFIAMLADHANKGLFHKAFPWMECLGRLAFPLFAVVFAYNMVHHLTRPRRFVLNAVVFGMLAQWPFHQVLALNDKNHYCLNILFTFLIAWGVNQLWNKGMKGVIASSLLFTYGGYAVTMSSYSWYGLGLILVLVGWFRRGGIAFPLFAAILLSLVVYGFPWMYFLLMLIMVSTIGPMRLAARVGRFMPGKALYLGYAGHLWIIYSLGLI